MVDYRRRKELSTELEAAGYKAKGSKLKNQPGNPEHVLNQARRGVLTYPPSDSCVCKFCNIESKETELPRDTSGKFVSTKTE